MSRPRLAVAVAMIGIATLALAGCTAPEPRPTSSSVPVERETPTPTPTAVPDPVFDGTAAENQPYFDWMNRGLIDSGVKLSGAVFIDALVGAGYPRELMEVTPDTTSIKIAADNVVFSIKFGDQCLLGQWGNIGYVSIVAPVLSTGRCIVGTERPA